MDSFILTIDNGLFRKTNAPWNQWMLNDPWSVGYVSQLIETKKWSSKEEWESFYYNSGEKRNALLNKNRAVLNDFQLQLNNKPLIFSLPWNIRNINYQYGRTKQDFAAKGQFFFDKVKGIDPALTVEICTECVRYRTICETWNGIIMRENNTILTLKRLFPNVEFKKTEGDIDHSYAVDYEAFKNGILICGIQIKPKSYITGYAPYLVKARKANKMKYDAYYKKTGKKVITIVSKRNGEILNSETLSII